MNVAVPVKPKFTVTGNPEAADKYAVKTTVPLASTIEALLRLRTTVGVASSSTINELDCGAAVPLPLVTLVMLTKIVSLGSSKVSCTDVTVTLPDVAPGAMMIWVPVRV